MPPYRRPNDLRASDADREATVERLRVAATEGRLEPDELEERLTAAYAARWCSELEGLTEDVTPPPQSPVAPRPRPIVFQHRRTNGLAVASLLASMFFWFGPVGAVAAIILGHVALSRISRSGGTQRGRGLALIGLTLGYLEIIAVTLWALASAPWLS